MFPYVPSLSPCCLLVKLIGSFIIIPAVVVLMLLHGCAKPSPVCEDTLIVGPSKNAATYTCPEPTFLHRFDRGPEHVAVTCRCPAEILEPVEVSP